MRTRSAQFKKPWHVSPSRFTCPASPSPVVAIDEGALVLVETRKDLSQVSVALRIGLRPNP